MKLIYGSTAIKFWFPDFDREPHDLDIITDEVTKNSNNTEYYWISAFNYLVNNDHQTYVTPDFLYTIKVSHASWDVNWVKTMKDIEFLKSKGCVLDKPFYNLLYKEWTKIHGKKNVKLSVKNEDFFNSNISRKYDHDELHLLFKYYERPLNESIRKDLNSPACSEELWNKLSYNDKLKTTQEELFVLTAERFILVDKPISVNHAIILMLKRMILSTTSGWFNLFIIENFDILRSDLGYFKSKLKELHE